MVDGLFGSDMEEIEKRRKHGEDAKAKASRLRVSEQMIENAVTNLVQNRVSIDRFTGGALETALFNQQPAFGDGATTLRMKLVVQNPKHGEIGLLLLLLKDLWTGDLPLGYVGNQGKNCGQKERLGTTCRYENAERLGGGGEGMSACKYKRVIEPHLAIAREIGKNIVENDLGDLKKWLEEKNANEKIGAEFLLAHAEDGVIWGKFDAAGNLITSFEASKDPKYAALIKGWGRAKLRKETCGAMATISFTHA
ncbi:MAG: hypothetical protein DCC52_19235 [Chloroflexi bacterium]|nr:MAG: hypothetical protein DCC52_19235 [Chloroflexota bacterium]